MNRENPDSRSYYVAPQEAERPRRPPITEIGIIHWLRDNLFNSFSDTIITIITLGIIGVSIYSFLSWALLQAQWEIVFQNMRLLGVGILFPVSEMWRAEVAAFITIFMSLFSVGVWGNVTRNVVIIIAVIIGVILIVPLLSKSVKEPPVHIYVEPNYNIREVNFLIEEVGQEVTFTLIPLDEPQDFLIENIAGYIENNRSQSNTSFDAFAKANTDINFTSTRTTDEYDLSTKIQVWDSSGQVIAETEFSKGSREPVILEWKAPSKGWYTFTGVRDDETTTAGAAWIKAERITVFRSTTQAREDRLEEYGEPPVLECNGCATQTNRTDMRFEGKRTIPQWFSLQLTPFIEETRVFLFSAIAIGVIGYLLGKFFLNFGLPYVEILKSAENIALLIAFAWFLGYIAVQIASAIQPLPLWSNLRIVVLTAFLLCLFLYTLVQLLKDSPQSVYRGTTLLWILAMLIILVILTGIQVSDASAEPALPEISSANYGGMLLTLILSAVAIIAAFPLGILLALGRQSTLPVVSMLCTIFIEVIRGVPLITLLFMGQFILPFFGLGLGDVDLLIRIAVVMTLFTAGYMAEVIRGGLQIIPKGQLEAAYALGLNNFWTNILIVLPQALRSVIPAIMGQAVSLFKDTSLLFVVGLFEILGTMNQILGDSQTGYLSFPREGYLYIGFVYFVFTYILAFISRRIERTGSGAIRRETI